MSSSSTGAVKPRKKAEYIDRLPPCNNACPAGENIQKWLSLLQSGDVEGAFQVIAENNPMPAIHGRVCYHPCEDFCNRIHFDGAVNIHSCERFIGDSAIENGWQFPKVELETGKKILIVGAGPAGLSAAYHLRKKGHEVTIYEAEKTKGGMLHTGIPAYRLPRNIIVSEIERIEKLGVVIECEHKVEDVLLEKEHGGFDAVFIAVGANRDKIISFETQNSLPIIGALEFLKKIEANSAPMFGEHLAVYGGGNTAIDVARSALRVGYKKATIIYRRDREHMPAFGEEILDAEKEGVQFCLLKTIKAIKGNKLDLAIMKLNEDGSLKNTGAVEFLSADGLVLALGQHVDSEFLTKEVKIEKEQDGTLIVDENLMTGIAGVFAGGDVMTHDRSVTKAVGFGKKATYHINAYLKDDKYVKAEKHELAGFDKLHLEEAGKVERSEQTSLPNGNRTQNFSEVVNGLNQDEVFKEAERCFSCGNCFECDRCYNVCPVKAITKLGKGKRYEIDKKVCVGCQLCFRKCPCGAIHMVEK